MRYLINKQASARIKDLFTQSALSSIAGTKQKEDHFGGQLHKAWDIKHRTILRKCQYFTECTPKKLFLRYIIPKCSGNLVLSKNLELSYENVVYQVKVNGMGYGLHKAKITVCEDAVGTVTLLYKGCRHYQRDKKQKKTADIVRAKALTAKVDQMVKHAEKYIPHANHPWRCYKVKRANIATINEVRSSSYPQGPQSA